MSQGQGWQVGLRAKDRGIPKVAFQSRSWGLAPGKALPGLRLCERALDLTFVQHCCGPATVNWAGEAGQPGILVNRARESGTDRLSTLGLGWSYGS